MSSHDFIGLQVLVETHENEFIEGTIVNISPAVGIKLIQATGESISFQPTQIKKLNLKSISKLNSPQSDSTNKVNGILNISSTQRNGTIKSRKPKIKKSRSNNQEYSHREEYVPNQDDGQEEELDEFDFNAGLASFDKKSVFKLIQSQDDTDISLRLHSHNKAIPKLLPTQSVLSEAELSAQAQELSLLVKTRSEPVPSPARETKEESDSDEESIIFLPRKSSRVAFVPSSEPAVAANLETLNAVPLVEINLKQYKELISITDIESSPPTSTRILQTSFSITSLLLSHLGPVWETFNPEGTEPSICIFSGDNKEKSKIALEVGIALLGRGFEVELFYIEKERESIGEKEDLGRFSKAGGRILREFDDLRDDYELILDAIMDNQIASTFKNPSIAMIKAATWLNEISLRVISIDSPFGIDHDTGLALIDSPLDPYYLVCCGAPRIGMRSSMHERDVFIVDDGVGFGVWNRVVNGLEKKRFGRSQFMGCRVIGK